MRCRGRIGQFTRVGLVVALALGSGCAAPTPTPLPVPATGSRSAAPGTSPADPGTVPSASRKPAAGMLSEAARADLRHRFGTGVSVAVAPLNGLPPSSARETGQPYAWSTIKPVIVVALIRQSGGIARLTGAQRDLVHRALTRSDNDAAAALHQALVAEHGGVGGAAEALTAVLRLAGDDRTEVSTKGRATFSSYGQTLWRVSDQVRFMAALARGCLLDEPATRYVLGQMGGVVPDQRWGLGTVGSPAFKGGWGPDPDGRYLVRQVGLLRAGTGRRYAVAITARHPDGSFASGTALVSAVARWVSRNVTTTAAEQACTADR